MTAHNLKFIRENYPDQNYNFIFKNIEQYVDIMNDDLFSQDELLKILTWNISDELKIKLLEFSNDEISVVGKDYSSAICLYILKNNLMESDLMVLFSSFENWVDSIQIKIFDYAVQYIESVIDNPKSVSEKLKNDLIRSDRLSRDLKVDLLISMMPDLDESLIKEILTLLDLTDYLKIFDTRSRPKFEINDENATENTIAEEIKKFDSISKNQIYCISTKVSEETLIPLLSRNNITRYILKD